MHLLRRGIAEDPRPFITHAKKKSLESIPGVKSIMSLHFLADEEIFENGLEMEEDQGSQKKLK